MIKNIFLVCVFGLLGATGNADINIESIRPPTRPMPMRPALGACESDPYVEAYNASAYCRIITCDRW